MNKKHLIRLGAGVVGAALLLPGLAMAGPYGHTTTTTVTTVTYGGSHFRPGPPPHAPAHGYRGKHQHQHRHHHRAPAYPVYHHAPVHRPPVYRAPTVIYHEPVPRNTLDFTIRYRTQY